MTPNDPGDNADQALARPDLLRQDGEAVTALAPAKVNLYLELTGKRQDGPHRGYHEMDSLMVFLDQGDQLTVRPADTLSLTVTGPMAFMIDDDPKDNLVLQAARALQAWGGISNGATIQLEKNLPVAAGIGGGSADAAAALHALNRLWQLELPLQTLSNIGLDLGADVPACLAATPVQVTGIGEHIQATTITADMALLLVNPMKPVSTPAIFNAFAKANAPFLPKKNQEWQGSDFPDMIRTLQTRQNSLQDHAIALCPEIKDCLAVLGQIDTAFLPRMSGSGATCFALFSSIDDATKAETTIRDQYPAWWTCAGQLLA